MSPARWTLILLAALTGVGAALHALQTPPAPASPPAAQAPAAAAARPLHLPAPLAASRAQDGSASRAATPPGSTVQAAATPRIGSEGYGPHIDRALAGTDAGQAWEAVQWLRQCASNPARRQSYESLRGDRIPQELLTQLMLEADAEERLCQTVTAWHWARLQELALRAIRGEVPNAASGYASMVKAGDIAPAPRQQVADALRRDANAGQPGSLVFALAEGAAWGLSDDERLAYLMALSELDGHGGPALVESWTSQGALAFKTAPTSRQLSAARVAGRQIVDRVRAGQAP
ncbi:MAG: hypothetical protein GXC94_06300 [Comamonadaceae bacterium]|jgi:hypothetical protein|nr:hypothetical protein [Comamonadaceae bacterium]